MKSKAFQFKEFAVVQDKCAMKVNTDGVLLAAWAETDNAKTILDIGTGTGVLALMMAQKNFTATIDAIDIDEDSFLQAQRNFLQSKWHNRIHAIHSSLQNFSSEKKYDCIITNPPYFVDDLKSANEKTNVAKHTISLPYDELLKGLSRLLHKEGQAFVVIPQFNFALFEGLANKEHLHINRMAEVFAVEGKNSPYILLLQLSFNKQKISTSRIVIQQINGAFTDEYKRITKDFYLNF